MSPEQKLTLLNIDIGKAEQQRNKDTLDRILANDLIFRRASGAVVDRDTYLEDLQNSENTYIDLCSEVADIKLSKFQNATVLSLCVHTKGKQGKKTIIFGWLSCYLSMVFSLEARSPFQIST